MSSIKTNYFLNLVNTVAGLLFPLITFPYASRIMMADGIGQVNFFSSIIAYITLFTCLGIPMYAIREIAKIRENERERSKIATEILLLHAGLSILGYVVVAIIATTVAKVQINIPLFLLLSTTIFMTAIGSEWFFQGIEDFKYITIRGIVVKTVAVVLLFLLVHTKEDIMWYAAYTVFGVLGGNVFNFIRLRKFIHIRSFSFKDLHPLRHLKPALHIFVLNIIVSIYVNLDTVMLGFMKDDAAVGYYTEATKLTRVILGIISPLGIVMLPRLSNLIATGQKKEFDRLANKAVNFVIALSLPLAVGLIIMGPTLIRLFCGQGYEPAILTLQIISPVVFIIALSNIIGTQILYPQGYENKVIISTAIGAAINFTMNCFLIPQMAQNGAALATVVAECSVTLTQLLIGAAFIPVKLFNRNTMNYLVATILMGVGICLISFLCMKDIVNLFVIPFTGCIIYFSYLYMVKDLFCIEIITLIKSKINR